jgi:hypothetical protein
MEWDNGRWDWFEFYTILIEAELPSLARKTAERNSPHTKWDIVVEDGDTRYLHPGAQDIIFEPAQTDLSEITQ